MITLVAQRGTIEKDGERALPHVLLVLDQIPSVLGGGERIVFSMAENLPSYGYRTSILTFAAAPDSVALQCAPCNVYLLPLTRTYNWNALRAAVELRRFIDRQEVRIVQTFFESADIWGGLVAKTTRAKLVWSRRDMGILRGRKHEIAYRWMSSAPDAVFAVSEQVRRHCIEVDGLKPERVHTVYNGLDIARWAGGLRSPKHEAAEVVVATVGNIRRVKGHDVLVRAAAQIRDSFPAARVSIAGDILEPAYFEELNKLVADLGLEDRVLFVGPVRDLKSYLAAADIFVLPSRSEGFSNAIIEAMAAGLPVVATDVGGNAEAVKDGLSGTIVAAEKVSELAEAITALLADPKRAIAMGMAGRMIVEERFTDTIMMKRTADVYCQLLKSG